MPNKIDWDNAPEGAERYNECFGVFFKKVGDKLHVCDKAYKVWLCANGDAVDWQNWNESIERPTKNKQEQKIYYIAGPISDRLDTYKETFDFMANDLKDQGHVVLSPSILPSGLKQEQYMDICIAMLRSATNIIMLEDWEMSPGARIEHDLAIKSESITVEYA